MADIKRFTDWALLLGATSTPFQAGSLRAGNDMRLDDLQSGGDLNIHLRQVIGKRPFLRALLMDPSAVTAWTKIGTSPASVTGIWRAYEQDGGLGAGYKSVAMSKGIILPVRLSGSVDRHATMEVLAIAGFAVGTGVTVGSTSGSVATVSKAFYPTNIVVGGTTFAEVRSIDVEYQYAVQDDDQLEPGYYYYDRYALAGNAVVKDLAAVTAARLEDGASEAVTVLFTDANNGANTVSVSLGTCHVRASIDGPMATLAVQKIGT